ncbi:phosphate-regulating neutral endopeptidase [Trichonephila clavipes]|nr:phosphate-regulating neutral endopeptidase [Trichonephila clavipes]
MRLQVRKGTVDGYEWRCRNQSKDNRHDVVRSVRKGTWFSESKLAITIILRLTRYWFGKSMNAFVVNDLKVNKKGIIDQYSKHSKHSELLRQLALEVINDIPDQAVIIYTDGSRSDTGKAGSGIFRNTPKSNVKISIRGILTTRSELIAINGALDHALTSNKDSIWILTGSRSSIQYLKNWLKIMDSTGLDIITKLARLVQRK